MERNEPTINNTVIINTPNQAVGAFAFSDLFGKKVSVKTPEQLMTDALQGFTDAHAKLETAQAAIATQVAEHEAEIEARQKALVAANESHSRLGRVAERFKELLA